MTFRIYADMLAAVLGGFVWFSNFTLSPGLLIFKRQVCLKATASSLRKAEPYQTFPALACSQTLFVPERNLSCSR
jgi:hypothetical protein